MLTFVCLLSLAFVALGCLASAVSAVCPNEGIRENSPSANLPDCRAYEQASPVSKNGLDATGTYPTVKASPAGDRVSFVTANGIPVLPDSGTQDTPLYLASREGEAWSTQGIMPEQSAGQDAAVRGWLPDFSQVFSRVLIPGTPAITSFLSRSSFGGSLEAIVPANADIGGLALAGASADGSKIFFEASGAALASSAAVGKPNLYLWDGKKILAVGILPDGSTSPGGSFAGPYDWARASTAAGGAATNYYVQEQRAISSHADRVYFSAGGSGQLYVRENPAAPETTQRDSEGNCIPDPTLACTIRVSASRKTNGTGEDGRDITGSRAAAFQAASADGSTAFFTSSEKLTNDANTGLEPPPPAIARANIDGSVTNLDFLRASSAGVAVEGSHLYWADAKKDAIGRAKLNGTGGATEVETAFITGADNPKDVTVEGEYIYWTNAADEKEGMGSIGRAKLGPNAEEVLQDFVANEKIETSPGKFENTLSNPRGIDVDAAHIYWANNVYAGFQHTEIHTLGRANLDGSGVEPKFIGFSGEEVVVNATKIYSAEVGEVNGAIRSRNLDGSEDKLLFLVPGAIEAPSLALDGSHLYWTNFGEGIVGRSNLDGSGPEPSFINGAGQPQGLAVDASHIFWSANQENLPNPGNDLYRHRIDSSGGELEDITVDNADTNGAEVQGLLGTSADGSYAYFVANGVFPSGPNSNGENPALGNCKGLGSASGTCNLYLWHEGEPITFIARLAVSKEIGTDAINWAPSPSGVFFFDFQKSARVSADGRTLLFRSQRQLSSYDNEGKPEFYLYRAEDESILCVSCVPSGAPPASPWPKTVNTPLLLPPDPAPTLTRSLSEDGQRVFFASTDALVEADKNGEGGCPTVGSEKQVYPACQDVYEWEANGSGSCESEAQNGGCLYLLSDGQGPEPSLFADASADGEEVFFFTRSALVRQDNDDLMDVYDASAGGGLVSQNVVESVPCEGEACKPGVTPPPSFESPGSASLLGPANPKPKRGHHKKKPRKHKKNNRKHGHRNAKAVGRAVR